MAEQRPEVGAGDSGQSDASFPLQPSPFLSGADAVGHTVLPSLEIRLLLGPPRPKPSPGAQE